MKNKIIKLLVLGVAIICGQSMEAVQSTKKKINEQLFLYAVKSGKAEYMQKLLKLGGIDINMRDVNGSTPLYWATHIGYLRTLLILLQMPEIEVNIADKVGDTPLHIAAWDGKLKYAHALLEHGADSSLLNEEKRSSS